MQCRDAREALTWAHDHHAEAAPETRAHLASCAACRTWADELGRLDAALAADPAVEPGPGFDTRFFARLAEAKAAPSRAFWPRLAWLGAALAGGTAAAALVFNLVVPTSLPPADLELAMNLELLEEMAVLSRLDEVEAFDVLAQVSDAELDAAAGVLP
jgi:hypothetical protein